MREREFEPKILAFLCNWCSYAGADLAGVSRLQYPPNIRVIRVMCSGSVSLHHLLHAFQKGADGVLVAGCHIGDCHYLKGNYMTLKRVKFIEGLLRFAGYDPARLRLEWISAAEGIKFAEVVRDFTSRIQTLGPTPSFEAIPQYGRQETEVGSRTA
ncbi:MAG TPA: hydrogenase iron-sulfur subunit [Syntrophobacteraceae bacterium]|nr:hydrogenase iron-sulfur subunit [Syntrophobacteraceae bacterium]